MCTDGVPSVDPPGRWSLEYATKAAGIAFHHFWDNNVRGDLQGQYDQVWGDVARAFSGNRWVLGYDPFNEPFSTSLIRFGDEHFDSQLECFYTGTAHIGTPSHGAPPLRARPTTPPAASCRPSSPTTPATSSSTSRTTTPAAGCRPIIGPMDLPNLVFNVHIYCGARSPVTGNPTNVAACAAQDVHSLGVRASDRPEMASAAQAEGTGLVRHRVRRVERPGAPGVDHGRDGRAAGRMGLLGLEVLRRSDGERGRVARHGRRTPALDRPRAEPRLPAGGGRHPLSFTFSPSTDVFDLAYVPNHRIHAPTLIFVPTELHYPHGYCARTTGARVTSARGSDLLEVANARSRAPGHGGGHAGDLRRRRRRPQA